MRELQEIFLNDSFQGGKEIRLTFNDGWNCAVHIGRNAGSGHVQGQLMALATLAIAGEHEDRDHLLPSQHKPAS